MEKTLKVLTLNIAHGRKDSAHQLFLPKAKILQNLDVIVGLLEREQPDVVALQEADTDSIWNGGFNHVEYLAQKAGYQHSFSGGHMTRLNLCYGTALLSKLPLSNSVSLKFENSRPLPAKGCVVCSIEWNGQQIDLVSLHLDFARKQVRRSQIDSLIELLAERANPGVIMGDFNCDWGSRGSALKHIAAELGLSSFKPQSDLGGTFRARGKRWDWVLVSNHFELDDYRHLPQVVSDHRAVVTCLNSKSLEQRKPKPFSV